MSLPLVEARGISKTYHLWPEPSDRLVGGLLRTMASSNLLPRKAAGLALRAADRRGKAFQALADVSFRLERGESLGVIGRNGSGKSTLLQILAGTLQPTGGTFAVRGRIAALLELGSGFNPEFTGRENALLQAALHGVSREEAVRRFPEIEEFAGIGQFIDQPVKVYSSGMMVRLAFATQTVLDPELFIVDEALAVGDVFFQARCAEFFRQRLAQGMSLILVSHDLPTVRAFCARTLVLHEGRTSFHGNSDEAISHYHQLHRPQTVHLTAWSPGASAADSAISLPPGETERNWPSTHEVGSREVEIVHCRLLNATFRPAKLFAYGEEIRVECLLRSKAATPGVSACMELTDRHRHAVYGVTSAHIGLMSPPLAAGHLHRFTFSFPANLGAGEYLLDLAIGWGDRGDGAPSQLVHRVAAIGSFQVHHAGSPRFFGFGNLDAQLKWG